VKIKIISKTEIGEFAINKIYKEDDTKINNWAKKKAKIFEDILLNPYRLVFEYYDSKFIAKDNLCRLHDPENYKKEMDIKLNKMAQEMFKNGAVRGTDFIIEVQYE